MAVVSPAFLLRDARNPIRCGLFHRGHEHSASRCVRHVLDARLLEERADRGSCEPRLYLRAQARFEIEIRLAPPSEQNRCSQGLRKTKTPGNRNDPDLFEEAAWTGLES
jgi:hypothetical protein